MTPFDFLTTRRSVAPKLLHAPGPGQLELEQILTAAMRSPDHGKLEPWRLIVLGPDTRADLRAKAERHGTEMEPAQAAKGVAQFDSPCLVAVIASPRPSDRIPQIEQTLSAGAVCLGLVNAALAKGWGASWLTGWIAHDRDFAAPAFGLQTDEWVAGLIHIGTKATTPPERPRPDPAERITWHP